VELAVKGPIPRRLIALLAIRAGEFVHADTLADQVWAGAPPPAARATLQSHMARLRRAVGAERIESGRAGYRLAAERSDVDAHRFVELAEKGRVAIAAGDVAAARGALDDALSLWRGPAYAEFGGFPALDSEAARLHQLRVDVRQWQFEAELAGPGAPPVTAIEAMVREHPTREGLWVLLMKALYRVGRQADALRAYQSARRFLLDELGIEPSRELREVEQMILMHDSALDPTISTTAPTAVPSETPQPPAEEIRERRTVTTAVIELPLPTVADPEASAGTFGPPPAATAFIAPMKQAA
jgi:DNA-binding SARP family transcriptional activator